MALAEANITPISLEAKEGLTIVNGTALSTGIAALAMHEVHCQATLSQLLTAMSVEAMNGTDESFHPFFTKVRAHLGQEESARYIYAYLARSKLVHRSNGSKEGSLRQDRYSIRTASQWIGPVLEDLLLAHQQVTIEANSVTDNPLVLVEMDQCRMLHGGNFQAKAITSAMEKLDRAVKLLVQCTELINPATNGGLPPNLVAEEASESFIWKGTDVMIAALQSELLALISARCTLDAIDVLTQISAIHLIAL